MSDTLELEPLPSSVRSARLFVVDRLQEWRCDDLVDKVALLTSELATNAVVHTGQPYSVTVERCGPGVRVEVSDRDDELPHVRPTIDLDRALADGADPLLSSEPGDDQRWFSGLGIVERTATAWGSETVPGNGKVVWFEVMGADADGGEGRSVMAELSDLRSPAPVGGLASGDGGEAVLTSPRLQEARAMPEHDYLVDDDRVIEERRYVEPRRSHVGRIILILLVIAALAIAAFFVLGGSADVDTKGDLEIPEVDVDVNAPDVDVNSEPAPPASADANKTDEGSSSK